MDDDLEEFVTEFYASDDIDLDYEFDAARFYDFTRSETDSEERESERWFEFAGNYPPSPFIVKLKWPKGISEEIEYTFAEFKDGEDRNVDNSMESKMSSTSKNIRGFKSFKHMDRDSSKAKTKSLLKPTLSQSSTLLKPTASQLAKQNQPHLVHSIRLRRFQKKLGNVDERTPQNSSVVDNLATKRQKLEAGYLSKIAQLKHQALLLHKVPKKVGLDVRPKVTIPKGPDLETAHRAEKHKSKINAELDEQTKSNVCFFRARPLNKKILRDPSLPILRRSKPVQPEFQVFHLKTSERAKQHASNSVKNVHNSSSISQNESTEVKRSNSVNALRHVKFKTVNNNFKVLPLNKKKLSIGGENCVLRHIKSETIVTRGLEFQNDKKFEHEPPTDSFSKLSLTSEPLNDMKPRLKTPLPAKGTNENTPSSFNQERESEKDRRGLAEKRTSAEVTGISPNYNPTFTGAWTYANNHTIDIILTLINSRATKGAKTKGPKNFL
ncbi:hypothetical protein FNV43_RR24200 [Rhamnella rubrinervis]|uniref:TPX2 central domain-containing protein n=1 Tax=Rhamnella rubrinervis TaxID=2594499 RepID=A0A8K0DRZ3_9ROSA|nr:hypothetical protein FNV43_RR24200 [Rhamnella rubrinervis]